MTYIVNAEITSHKGAANGYADLDAGSKVPTARLGDSSANSATYLRGDRTWAAPTTVAVRSEEHTSELQSQR